MQRGAWDKYVRRLWPESSVFWEPMLSRTVFKGPSRMKGCGGDGFPEVERCAGAWERSVQARAGGWRCGPA